MTLYSELAISALKEVIEAKGSSLKTVKGKISDICQEISLLTREDQDVAELTINPHALLPQIDFQRPMTALNSHLKQALNLEDCIAMHKAMLPSSIQLLPVEILSYILVLCMESTLLFPDWRDSSFPPFIFGRVCSLFRSVMLSTPPVWSAVSIHIVPGRKWETRLTLFLTLSRSHPLSLELIWHPSHNDPHTKSVNAVLDQLPPLISTRLQKIQLFVPDQASAIILGSHPLPILEYLSLGSQNDDPVPFLTRPGFAPKLQMISFPIRHSKPLLWQLPWSQLTEIESKKSRLTGSQVLCLFAQCPSLERCCLQVGRYNPNALDQDPDHLVVLPHLKSLVFIIDIDYDCFGLFPRLVLPSLSRVEFRNAPIHNNATSVWSTDFLVDLIERSGCTLTSLVLVGFLLHERELRDTVKSIPSLVEFEASYGWDIVPPDLRELLLARRWGDLR
ncbi:hypothetical protein D9757_003567 [Collybiopsis confluens]|uniref:F-box domain-containing protein n=1 Tax=Collybiopsis confluens TaxID=2823264 RepID=A0A8H5HUT1_9AGAR|nr:hypothetical protein D9757_003567 [Collybiopsis confluens]